MLSSFFKTSKPIHYLLIFLMAALLIGFIIIHNTLLGWEHLWWILLVFASMLVFQFLTVKNGLTDNSSYALWVFTCLTVIACIRTSSAEVLLALLFYFLSFRRLLSLRSGHGLIKKIFDASFWMAIATLIFPWSALFFIIIFIGILIYAFKSLKYWAVPFIAMGCIGMLSFTIDYLLDTTFLISCIQGFTYKIDYSFATIGRTETISIIVALIATIASAALLLAFPNISLSARSRFALVGFAGITGVAICVLTGSIFFLIPVIAIFTGRFIQETDNKVIKEILLWLPLVFLLLAMFRLF